MSSDDSIDPIRMERKLAAPELPKRFYRSVTVAEEFGEAFVALDGRSLKTPGRRSAALPHRAIVEAMAAEWEAQASTINSATMPVTRLINTAIDGVAEAPGPVRTDIVAYAGSDLVCYRADSPAALVERQAAYWDPPMEWLARAYDAPLRATIGVVPIEQPASTLARIGTVVDRFDHLALTALLSATALTGSAVLALALAEQRLDASAAWEAANVDEDWQIAQWGEDAEAAARRRDRWRQMQAAAFVLSEVLR